MIVQRFPDAVLDFWFGQLRSVTDASENNWRIGMLKWRIGPFARNTEDRRFLDAQREWCEQIHKESIDGIFANPVWETPKGLLAKLIVLDQFPRAVYRGTPLAFAYDEITTPIIKQILDEERYRGGTELNEIERLWVYIPMTHKENMKLQEQAVENIARWSMDFIAVSPPELRKINQYVSWYLVKAFIEHSESLLLYDRFPHRNPILRRLHRAGEPRYLNDPFRPLWSFTQPPELDYFAILGFLYRIDEGLDENRISRQTLASLQNEVSISPDSPESLMDVFDLTDGASVSYRMLYRHARLQEKANAFEALTRTPKVADLKMQIKSVVLKNPDEAWPPRSVLKSVKPAIDVQALIHIVNGRSFEDGDS